MKVGIISDSCTKNRSGIGHYTCCLIENLSRKIPEEIFLIDYEDKVELSSFKKIIIENPFKYFYKTFMWYVYLGIQRFRFQSLDVIHNPAQLPTFFKFSQKYVITIHDLTPIIMPNTHTMIKSVFYRLFLARTIKNSDAIISVSEHTKRDLIKIFNVPENKVVVIYHGIDTIFRPYNADEKGYIKIKYGLDYPFILHIGTLEPRKNISSLIGAFKIFIQKNPGFKLIIVGKKGWKYRKIYSLIKNLGLSGDIRFLGYIPQKDLPGFYNCAEAFVFPSLYEGFGLPVLEAMACGTPVITSNVSSLPEVAGEAGILVEPCDINEIANALVSLINNKNLREELVSRGIERAKNFKWERSARDTLEVYRKVMNKL